MKVEQYRYDFSLAYSSIIRLLIGAFRYWLIFIIADSSFALGLILLHFYSIEDLAAF